MLDELAACWADLCLVGERQTAKLQDGAVSGLPHWLTTGDVEGPVRYLAQIQVGYVERARRAAQRTFIPGSESGGFGQTDLKTPTQSAWLGEREAGRCLDASLALLAVTALHALDVTQRNVPQPLAEFAADVRSHVPKIEEIRMLGPELGRLAASLPAASTARRVRDGPETAAGPAINPRVRPRRKARCPLMAISGLLSGMAWRPALGPKADSLSTYLVCLLLANSGHPHIHFKLALGI